MLFLHPESHTDLTRTACDPICVVRERSKGALAERLLESPELKAVIALNANINTEDFWDFATHRVSYDAQRYRFQHSQTVYLAVATALCSKPGTL